MNVRFIDTSVLVNKLRVPGMCEKAEIIDKEFREAVREKEVLILPIATIIETGNHIAHIPDGNKRRTIAETYGEYLKKQQKEKHHGNFMGLSWIKTDCYI